VKILIRATNWVGDAIMALPALRAVRKRFPDAEIAIVGRTYVADIYRDQEICNQLISYDSAGLHAGFSGRERLAAELRTQKFDVALLLQNAFDAAWLAWRANIAERIGYARDGRSFLLTKAVPLPRPGEVPAHEKFYYLELLRRAGWLDSVQDESFIGLHPIPVRHGKTIGELATQFREEAFPKCKLTVLPMKNWDRAMWFDQTGLPWVMPSPNMPTLDTAIVYPGMCLLEGTNISEGRGTTRPFEIFGAPFIDPESLCRKLNDLNLPGVFFRENYFQPTFQKFAGELCGGAQIHVPDRNIYRAFQTGVEIVRCIRRLYPENFTWKQPPYEYEHEKLPIQILLGGPAEDFFHD